MLLTVMRHGGTQNFLARIFNCKEPNFERLIIRFVTIVSPLPYKSIVESAEKSITFYNMSKQKKSFCTFQAARYVTNACFLQCTRSTVYMKEVQQWYNVKHKLHGQKYRASLLPDGLCISCNDHARGRRLDLKLLQSRSEFHK